ncbi:uncharacterized protein BX663DRAFT_512127 [Cokeromyces recurvatus]|uniref:uncharacterized protein n=1 Tax=Cokeromyces recurvatus TaxID=90255 RepID=UPI00221EE0C6|nr:uncharacterized protein BX663DRAFT_512127 [Cokeromyces recurvatus]KAI7902211.1 hypothetical protein BX663DRAFT_512127 [Cokeromyces recurvatus]
MHNNSQHLLPSKTTFIPTNIKTSYVAPTRSCSNKIVVAKRQQESVVHITITAAGTVIYTQTATSYSYIPSYSPVYESPAINGNNSNQNDPNSHFHKNNNQLNIGAIIGGVVGGVALIALIGLGFLFMRRRAQKQKREKEKNEFIDDDDDSYYQTNNNNRHSTSNEITTTTADGIITKTTAGCSPLAPRHLVAPLEGDGRESKFYPLTNDGYYYEDIIAPSYPPTKAFYSRNNSITSDSLPSTAIDSNNNISTSYNGMRHVPNEVDYPVVATNLEERHVPHLKDDDDIPRIEPPHTRD